MSDVQHRKAVMRIVIQQTQPVKFDELAKAMARSDRHMPGIKPHTTLDLLNQLVTEGFVTVDEEGRFYHG